MPGRSGHKLSYDDDSSLDVYKLNKKALISKIHMKFQYIKDEEQTIKELI